MGKHAELPRQRTTARAAACGRHGSARRRAILSLRPYHAAPLLDHAPASVLTLSIQFDEAPRFNGSQFVNTQVGVTVNVFSGGHAVTLTSEQKLTCNGVQLANPGTGELSAVVDRPPAGGSYAFAYTDEQGRMTTFSVLAIAPLTLISPAPGAAVAIPRPVATVPTPTPGAPPPGDRTPDLDQSP
jgi:hypothetical protein